MIDQWRVEGEVKPGGDIYDTEAGLHAAPGQQSGTNRLSRIEQCQNKHVEIKR